MWDGLPVLFLLCLLMAAASFLAGILPLSLSLSARQLRLLTALGTGVLVGTSLIVIIPEGVETLYSASGDSHSHAQRAVAPSTRSAVALDADLAASIGHDMWRRDALDEGVPSGLNVGFRTGPDDGFDTAEMTTTSAGDSDAGGGDQDSGEELETPEEEEEEAEETPQDPHAWVGVSLIAGFILMYLIDTLPRQATKSTRPQRFHISLGQFSLNRTSSLPLETPASPNADSFPPSDQQHHHPPSRATSTTVGLVIHAAADGIALGASSSTPSSNRLSLIIFAALMLHKAPAAFGLTAVLLKQGLSKRAARAHLVVFALAAPAGALATWAVAHVFGSGVPGGGNPEFATGVLLLFSAGTFLYVAMHTMQEHGADAHEHGNAGAGGVNGYVGVPTDMYAGAAAPPPKRETGGVLDTLVCVGGMLIPLLTQFGHGH